MVPLPAAATGAGVEATGREDPLPRPRGGRRRVLPFERGWQRHRAKSRLRVGEELDPNPLEMSPKGRDKRLRQHRHAVLPALSVPDGDRPALEVDVLDPEPSALQQAETGSVEQGCHDPGRPAEFTEDPCRFLSREDDRHPGRSLRTDNLVQPRQVLAQHFPVQEQQRAEGLVLCRGADARVGGEVGQVLPDLVRAHLGGMLHSVVDQKPLDPEDVGLFRSAAVVPLPNGAANASKESRGARRRRLGAPGGGGRCRSRLVLFRRPCRHGSGSSWSPRRAAEPGGGISWGRYARPCQERTVRGGRLRRAAVRCRKGREDPC